MDKTKNKTGGSLRISGNAVLKIAETAAAEVEGAALSSDGRLAPPDSMLPLYGAFYSPVKVKFSADAVVIEVAVVIRAGFRAHVVAEAIQENVKSAVQNMTGIAVSKVNVKVAGIQNETAEEKK